MIYDLTIPLNENTLPFPDSGDPHMTWKHLVDHNVYKCQVCLFSMVTHLGTHVDAPLHYCKGGKTTAEIDLSAYAGPAVCLDMPDLGSGSEIDITEVMEKNRELIQQGDIVVLRTGYEELVGNEKYFDFKDFAENTGAILESYGCKGIGFDMPSIDRSGLAHQAVLSRGMSIIESLINLRPLVGKRFYLSAVPLKFTDGDGSPVRAYAVMDD
ncbi:MAG: cyclase family protein [Lachnospiraceae bacterium]|nr:cyclase family protein [Lachnospiraceae bacterium]